MTLRFSPAPMVATLAVAAYLGCELFLLSGRLGFPLDDSWIHLTFARNLAAGHGLSYNPGQWVTGSTAPLWSALLALGFLLPGAGFLIWPKLLGAACFLATVSATSRLAGELGCAATGRTLAGLLVASTHWLVWSALSGMEVHLFTALALWGSVWHLRERRQAKGESGTRSTALLAAACLARPEGLLLLALCLLDRTLSITEGESEGAGAERATGYHWRLAKPVGLVRPLAIAALVLVPVAVFYQVAGGSPLPATLAAKTRPDPGILPDLRYLRLVIDILFRSQPITTLLAAAGTLALWSRPTGGRWLLPAWLSGQALFYAALASESAPPPVGNFGRYYFPLLPVVAVLGVLALEPWTKSPSPGFRMGGSRLSSRALVIVVLLVPQAFGLASGALTYGRTVGNVEDSDVRAALWLRERLDPRAVLAVQDAGALGFFLDQKVVDLVGLVNPEVRPVLTGTPGDPRYDPEVYWEERLARYLEGPKPDYLVVFSSSYPVLAGGRAPGFEPVTRFEVENNLAMAGEVLVVLSTPWTRFPLSETGPQGSP